MEQSIIPDNFYRVSIKGLVLDSVGKFLLVRNERNLWDLPGGGMDFWENPEETLRREIREEMWLEIEYIDPQPQYLYTAKWLDKEFYVANIVYRIALAYLGFTPTYECIEIAFFSVDEAQRLNIYPKTREFLKLYNPEDHIQL